MGCGGSKLDNEEPIDTPLLSNTENLPYIDSIPISTLESYNAQYAKSSIILKQIEELRNTLIDKLDQLILNTGACVFTNPDILTCLKCVFWKISAEYSGNLRKAEIRVMDEDPYIEVKGNMTSKQTTFVINLVINYISEALSQKQLIKTIDLQIPVMIYILQEMNEEIFMKRIIEKNGAMTYLDKEFVGVLKRNNKKIRRGVEIFTELNRVYQVTREKINFEFSNLRKNLNYMEKIDSVGMEAFSQNIEDICMVAFLSKNINKGEENLDKIYASSVNSGRSRFEEKIEGKIKYKMSNII